MNDSQTSVATFVRVADKARVPLQLGQNEKPTWLRTRCSACGRLCGNYNSKFITGSDDISRCDNHPSAPVVVYRFVVQEVGIV